MRRVIAVLAVAGMVVAGCGDEDDSTSEGSSAPSSGFDGTIQWGFIAERNGEYQAIGVPSYNAARLAVQQINEDGGVEVDGKSYEVELVSRDSRTEEAQASAASIELVEEMGIKYVFGGIGKIAPLIRDVTEANDAIYFSSSGSAAAFMDESDYLFSTVPATNARIDQSLEAIRHFLPDAERMAAIYPQVATADDVSPVLNDLAGDHDFTMVAEEKYPAEAADITSNLTSVRAADPDVLVTGWDPVGVAATIAANAEVSAAPAIYGWGVSCVDVLDAGVDVPFVGFPVVGTDVVTPRSDVAKQFVADYEEFAPNEMENLYAALWNYDFFFMLRDAIEAAGTFEDVDAVKDALLEIETPGVNGSITFDENRTAVFGFEFCFYPGSGGVDALETYKAGE